jgi:hypothetical protein
MRCALILVICLAARPVVSAAQRTYWKTTVAQVAAGTVKHTHLELDSVVVDYTRAETDSDFHIRVRAQGDTVPEHFVVAECIPKLPCRHPKLGEIISLKGILRQDSEHGWWEIHPVEVLWP